MLLLLLVVLRVLTITAQGSYAAHAADLSLLHMLR